MDKVTPIKEEAKSEHRQQIEALQSQLAELQRQEDKQEFIEEQKAAVWVEDIIIRRLADAMEDLSVAANLMIELRESQPNSSFIEYAGSLVTALNAVRSAFHLTGDFADLEPEI